MPPKTHGTGDGRPRIDLGALHVIVDLAEILAERLGVTARFRFARTLLGHDGDLFRLRLGLDDLRLRRRLAPAGTLIFTTLAEGSFFEWRRAHGDLVPGIRDYPSAQALAAMGLDVAIETIPMAHTSAREFLRSVKGIGAGTPRPGHRPLTPRELRAVMGRFEAKGSVASYMVATCIAGPA